MAATDVLSDDEVIYEVGADAIAQNAVQPLATVPNNRVLDHYMSSAEELARHSMARKIQAGHITNHHGAMQMYLANANLANVMGLSDEQKMNITPFPSPSKVTIVNGGSDEKLIGVVESLVGKLMDKVQTPAASPDPQPIQPAKPDTQQTVQPVVAPTTTPTTWWDKCKKYSNVLAWILAAGTSLTAGVLALRPTPTPSPTPTVQAPSDIEGTIGVTIE